MKIEWIDPHTLSFNSAATLLKDEMMTEARNQRLGTFAETREVATQISDRMRKLFPVSWAALTDGLTEYKFGYEENNDE